jgi:hypothetical protein
LAERYFVPLVCALVSLAPWRIDIFEPRATDISADTNATQINKRFQFSVVGLADRNPLRRRLRRAAGEQKRRYNRFSHFLYLHSGLSAYPVHGRRQIATQQLARHFGYTACGVRFDHNNQGREVMRRTQLFIRIAAIGSAWLLSSCATTSPTSAAAKINPHIHFVAGGFHLVVAQEPATEKIATSLHDTYKVAFIAPGHCTGEPTFAALQRTFGDHCLYAGLGTTLDLGANPRAASERRAAGVLGEGDLRTYRTLLAQSDENIGG